ncbi:MAG: hypothetical protein ABIH46_10240, partial [Chloroflexota bacterium]
MPLYSIKMVLRNTPWLKDIGMLLLMAVLTLLFHWRIAFTGQILPTYDLFNYFYPYKAYVSTTLRQGELPLWNPYIFMGVPCLANIQAAVFYPFNLLTVGLEPPQAVNLSILAHVFLAGAFMYAFSRCSLCLDRLGALVAGIVFMFSGFLSGQIGHINQLNASVWLPLLLLVFDQAFRRRSVVIAVLGSFVFGIQVLAGHPQEAFLGLVGLGIFAVFRFCQECGLRRAGVRLTVALLKSWRDGLWAAAILIVIVLLGLGLIAFQILPTAELSSLSIRGGGLKYREAMSFSLPPWELFRSLLPSFLENPYGEFVAYVGIIGLGLAALAFRARRHPYIPFCIALIAIGLFFAFGGFNPASYFVYNLVPGLVLFRVPARWLFLYTLGAAMCAGIGFSFLLASAREGFAAGLSLRRACRRWLATCLGLGLILLFLSPFVVLPQPLVLFIWAVLIALSAALFWLGPLVTKRAILGGIVAFALVVELFFATIDLEMNHLVPSFAYTSLRPAVTQLLVDKEGFRVLSIASSEYDTAETGELGQLLGPQFSKRQIDDLMTCAKYKEILAPNVPMVYRIAAVDGYDGGLLPLRRYLDFKKGLLMSGSRNPESIDPGSPDALLRNVLGHIPDTPLLGAMNVKYVIDDKRNDVWIDDTYYDLSNSVVLDRDESLVLNSFSSFEATALGLVTYLSGGETIAQGEPVAEVSIEDDQGEVVRVALLAGVDTAEERHSAHQGVIAHQRARAARSLRNDPEGFSYYTKIKFEKPSYAGQIRMTAHPSAGRLHIVGASLGDERTMASQPLAVNERLPLINSGDVTVYRYLDFLPRSFLVHRAHLASGAEVALEVIRGGVQGEVVLSDYTGPVPARGRQMASRPGESVEVVLGKPTQIAVKANVASPGFLVLSETFYPGWRATV